jgi:hypothetical protein
VWPQALHHRADRLRYWTFRPARQRAQHCETQEPWEKLPPPHSPDT